MFEELGIFKFFADNWKTLVGIGVGMGLLHVLLSIGLGIY